MLQRRSERAAASTASAKPVVEARIVARGDGIHIIVPSTIKVSDIRESSKGAHFVTIVGKPVDDAGKETGPTPLLVDYQDGQEPEVRELGNTALNLWVK